MSGLPLDQTLDEVISRGGLKPGEFVVFGFGRRQGKSLVAAVLAELASLRVKDAERARAELEPDPVVDTSPSAPKSNRPHGPQRVRKGKARRW